ncbi:TROVE domain-containing protein [Rhodopseudomonas sp. BR0C11]|uniref:TROVE domain-containing protein n=1 Tax=Rhodopseudomonas sp. BR0C11 TaxID=2269370 RepID=UPI0013DF9E6D|nr:TROVE domain-containing protein [Rhodopseudomonas sp. BR0C11]NEV75629.1 TROVE domain-containing protein [Rhodopseudomonas sp. BR0C11]
MRLNVSAKIAPVFTHEGAPAIRHLSAEQQLRRSVMSCLLWEREFYEDGKTIADRIVEHAEKVPPAVLAGIAIEARETFNLRHVPLLLLDVLSKTGKGDRIVADTVDRVIQRADEMGELLAIYWRNGRKMVPAQMRSGLARALCRFDEHRLAKYDRDGAVKLRDVLRMVRPRPANDEQSALFRRIKDRTLSTPDTWEVALSGGADKRETFERLLREEKLGYLALLRNLRGMAAAGVDQDLIRGAILARKGAHRVLPFRYVAAARAAPQFEPFLDQALQAAIADLPRLGGRTIVLVDVSKSMEWAMSQKSDMVRMDAAAALGAIVNAEQLRLFTFSDRVVEVPPRRGMAGVDAIKRSQAHNGTALGAAVAAVNAIPHDRLIVITDEQSADPVPPPGAERAYMINVASNRNGVGYGRWIHIDGFSEGVLRFIHEVERSN